MRTRVPNISPTTNSRVSNGCRVGSSRPQQGSHGSSQHHRALCSEIAAVGSGARKPLNNLPRSSCLCRCRSQHEHGRAQPTDTVRLEKAKYSDLASCCNTRVVKTLFVFPHRRRVPRTVARLGCDLVVAHSLAAPLQPQCSLRVRPRSADFAQYQCFTRSTRCTQHLCACV